MDDLVADLSEAFSNAEDVEDELRSFLNVFPPPPYSSLFTLEGVTVSLDELSTLDDICSAALSRTRESDLFSVNHAVSCRVTGFYRRGFECTELPLVVRKCFGRKSIDANVTLARAAEEAGDTVVQVQAYIGAQSVARDLAKLSDLPLVQRNLLAQAFDFLQNQLDIDSDERRVSYAHMIGAQLARQLTDLALTGDEELFWARNRVFFERDALDFAQYRGSQRHYGQHDLADALLRYGDLVEDTSEQFASYAEAKELYVLAGYAHTRTGSQVAAFSKAAHSSLLLALLNPQEKESYLGRAKNYLDLAKERVTGLHLPFRVLETRLWLSLFLGDFDEAKSSFSALGSHERADEFEGALSWYSDYIAAMSNGASPDARRAVFVYEDCVLDDIHPVLYRALRKVALGEE